MYINIREAQNEVGIAMDLINSLLVPEWPYPAPLEPHALESAVVKPNAHQMKHDIHGQEDIESDESGTEYSDDEQVNNATQREALSFWVGSKINVIVLNLLLLFV